MAQRTRETKCTIMAGMLNKAIVMDVMRSMKVSLSIDKTMAILATIIMIGARKSLTRKVITMKALKKVPITKTRMKMNTRMV